jgi:hypothetical protein
VRRIQIWLVGLMFVLAAPRVPAGPPTPILIELFTSEGYSDCPAADVLLDKLVTTQPVAGAQLVALEQHVDYWDRLGWKDHFETDVKRGENHGRVLSHTAVVRRMLPIGEVTSPELSTARGEVSLAPDWQRHAIKVVAFVQERRGRQVLASAAVPLKNARP